MLFRFLIVFLLMTSGCPVWAQSSHPPVGMQDEGGTKAYPVNVIDCVGAGVSCAVSAGVATMTITGGGSGLATTDIDTSAKLDAIVTDNTGSGALVFNDSPTMTSLVVNTSFTMGSDLVSAKPGATVTVCSSTARGSDVCDYTCDGTDDDVQIQAAIDAVIAATATYGEVSLSEGTFNLKDTINITNSTSVYSRIGLSCAYGTGTQIHAQNDFADDTDTYMFAFTEAADLITALFAIENCLLTGNNGNITIGAFDTNTGGKNLWDLRFDDVALLDFGLTALEIDDPWGFRFKDGIIENCSQGAIQINAGSKTQGASITNSKIVENGQGAAPTEKFAININGVDHVRIIGNELDTEASGGYAIRITDGQQNVIVGNTFFGDGDAQGGIYIDVDSDENNITSNSFAGLVSNGIHIFTGATANVVMANTFDSITYTEIDNYGTNTHIFGNKGDDAATITSIVNGDFGIRDGGTIYAYSSGNDKSTSLSHNDTSAFLTSSSGHLYLTPASGSYLIMGSDGLGFAPLSDAAETLGVSGSNEWLTLYVDNIQSGSGILNFNNDNITTTGVVTATGNVKGTSNHLRFNLPEPEDFYTNVDTQVLLWRQTDAAMTITTIECSLDASANELNFDFKWADDFIGFASATLIVAGDTTSGVSTITAGWNDATIPVDSDIYIELDATPHADINQLVCDLIYDYD